ncbi:MAG: Flp family type IVb pilin [Alphaproteobacteria bacterium]|nr:Flp family type IVb pilin [Alphaproteobacteria bacterium]
MLQLCAKKEAFVLCEKGAVAIEYGLIAAGIAVAISSVVFTVGGQIAALLANLGNIIATPAP